jgi:nucleotide-binding universal stress UspA family protein
MNKGQPLLVPINDDPAGLEALALAGAIAKGQKAPVHVVHVIEVVRSLPVDAEMEWEARNGEQLLRRAEEFARQHDFSISTDLLQARQAGQAIVDEAHARRAAAVVIGLAVRRVVGDVTLGATGEYVLKHARCPVWLIREAAKD